MSSGSTDGYVRSQTELKAQQAATASLMPLLQGIISNSWLSGTAAPTPTDPSAFFPSALNLFTGASVPHMPFYIEQVKLENLFPSGSSPSMTEESFPKYEFARLGEYIGMPQVIIVAPALVTYTASEVDVDHDTSSANGDSNVQRFFVDDLHYSREAIRYAGLDGAAGASTNAVFPSSGGTYYGRMTKLSQYILKRGGYLPTISSNTISSPSAFLRGRDYFPAEDAMCSYCKFAPFYLLRQTTFEMQDAQQDIFGPAFLVAWHRIWASPESVPRDELIHGSDDPSQLRVWSAMSQRQWVVTLPVFWGVGGFAQYLPIRALHNHTLTFKWTIAPLKSIIVGSAAHVDLLNGGGFLVNASGSDDKLVCKTTSTGALPLNGMPIATAATALPAVDIAATHFSFYFTFHRVWINQAVRKALHESSGKKVVVLHNQVTTGGNFTSANGMAGTPVTYSLTPTLTTAAYLWTTIRNSQVVQNKPLNFGGPRNPLYAPCGDVGEGMPLLMSVDIAHKTSQDIISSQSAFYMNKVAPHVFAARNRIPDGMYLRSWGVGSPYSLQKRGFCNLSALGEIDFTLTPNKDAFADLRTVGGVAGDTVQYNQFAWTYATFSWKSGMGGKDWANGSR